jgi:hypothetical protein
VPAKGRAICNIEVVISPKDPLPENIPPPDDMLFFNAVARLLAYTILFIFSIIHNLTN